MSKKKSKKDRPATLKDYKLAYARMKACVLHLAKEMEAERQKIQLLEDGVRQLVRMSLDTMQDFINEKMKVLHRTPKPRNKERDAAIVGMYQEIESNGGKPFPKQIRLRIKDRYPKLTDKAVANVIRRWKTAKKPKSPNASGEPQKLLGN